MGEVKMDELRIEIENIVFDCFWEAQESDAGETYPVLAGVYVGDQNITDIISREWWNKIEKVLVDKLEEDRRKSK
jgi:hypothetical protein